jgi:hypothetical protein
MRLFKLSRNWSPEELLQRRLRFDADQASTSPALAPAIHLLQRSHWRALLAMRAHRIAVSSRCHRCQPKHALMGDGVVWLVAGRVAGQLKASGKIVHPCLWGAVGGIV